MTISVCNSSPGFLGNLFKTIFLFQSKRESPWLYKKRLEQSCNCFNPCFILQFVN